MRAFDEQAVSWRTGDVIDDKYEVTSVLGRGGMGQVHRVRHLGWGIDLAVKSPLPKMFRGPADVDRFVTEAQTWVSIGLHPNVCCCHYVRVLGGIPRLFAEYVPGGSLHERIDDGSLYRGATVQVTARVLRIASQLARGLAHAHDRGVLHLDMKPANVLLDSGVDGAAKITDFGLARARAAVAHGSVAHAATPGEMTLATPGGDGMTPAYAAPEQAARATVGRRSDLYSFAVSVLEMFTGGVSWRSGSAAGAVLAALLNSGTSRSDIPPMPPELAHLMTRCLRTDPEHRPASMTEVAEELEALYAATDRDAPPLTPPNAVELRAAEHNNRALSLLDLDSRADAEEALRSALDVDAHHLDAVYNFGLLRWRNGEITDDDLLTALQTVRVHTADPWQARCALAQVHLERGDLPGAREILDALARDHPGEQDVRAALGVLASGRIGHAGPDRTMPVPWHPGGSPNRSVPARFTPDGSRLITGGRDGEIMLWDIRSGECLRTCGGSHHGTTCVDVSADSRTGVLANAADETIEVWDLTTGRCRHRIRLRRDDEESIIVHDLRLAPDGRRVFVTFHHRELSVVDVTTGTVEMRVGGLDEDSALAVSPDGSQLLVKTNRYPHNYKLLHVDLGKKEYRVVAELDSWISAMAFTPDSSAAVTAGDDHRIRVWDPHSGECRQDMSVAADRIRALAFSQDGRWALSGGEDVRFWDMAEGRCLRTFHGHTAVIRDVWLSRDGRSGLSVSEDNTVRSWSLELPADYQAPLQLSRPHPVVEVGRLGDEVRELVGQAERAIAGSNEVAAYQLLTRARAIPGHEQDPRTLRVWRELGRRLPRVGLNAAWTTRLLSGRDWSPLGGRGAVSMSADARLAVSALGTNTVLWDLESGAPLREFPAELVDGAELSADGRWVVCAQLGRVQVYSVENGAEVAALNLPHDGIPGTNDAISVAIAGDGGRVLLGNEDGTLLRWDLASGRRIRTPSGHRRVAKALWMNTDGRTCVSAAMDSVRLWDLETGQYEQEIMVNRDAQPRSVCLSPDGGLIVAAWHRTPSMLLWNAGGDLLHEFGEDAHDVLTARFSPDGRFVFAGDEDGAITVWDVRTGARIHTITGHRGGVWDIRLSPDGRYALSGSHDGSLRLWELDWRLTPSGAGGAW